MALHRPHVFAVLMTLTVAQLASARILPEAVSAHRGLLSSVDSKSTSDSNITSILPRIAFITTGGTIAMVHGANGTLIPAQVGSHARADEAGWLNDPKGPIGGRHLYILSGWGAICVGGQGALPAGLELLSLSRPSHYCRLELMTYSCPHFPPPFPGPRPGPCRMHGAKLYLLSPPVRSPTTCPSLTGWHTATGSSAWAGQGGQRDEHHGGSQH